MDLEDRLRAEREARESGPEGAYRRYLVYLNGRDASQRNATLFALLISSGVALYLLEQDRYISAGLLFVVGALLYFGIVGDTHKLLTWHQMQEDYRRTDD